ncbi:hypothetical protein KBX50_25895 [Micromonospora sp. C51]|uniref:hypothetical protein n=1 Tax=Micromonospora sp. C51 TaxID=2824879 RepID=UPI001B38A699|nr:hypothetical protein [Micromonospora sp. C51]MBQ1051881.1 hypothetical protein [Micromonospora sp. C51]
MRARTLLIAAIGVSLLAGCTSRPNNVGGAAGPAGTPSATATVTAPTSVPGTPSATATVTPPASVPRTPSPTATKPAGSTSPKPRGIRATDWANVRLGGVSFMDLGDITFRNGRASSGANNCVMLPGGARPVYAEYLTEEPANSPITEDALILIECGSDAMDQALIMVQLGYDQKERRAVGVIEADPPSRPGERMTFLSYAVEQQVIVTTVRRADGTQETRRYRFNGGNNWGQF